MKPIAHTPTHLITGFLGAGKTTLINALLTHKSHHHADETWGLLMNEFGKIGIDGTWLAQDNLSVREVSGGCICCSSQMPMQINLARLLASRPARLIIEPTGLAHADTLIHELSQRHWQGSLSLRQVICILNSKQWQEERYRQHEGYQTHVKYADVVVMNQTDILPSTQNMASWVTQINPNAKIILFEDISHHWQDLLSHHHLNDAHATQAVVPLSLTDGISKQKPSLTPLPHQSPPNDSGTDITTPYRYHDTLGDFIMGGWVLDKDWVFDEHALQTWLLNLPNYHRIKGVVHTETGFISINITPFDVAISPFYGKSDNKLEMIFAKADFHGDWQVWDDEMMNCVIRH